MLNDQVNIFEIWSITTEWGITTLNQEREREREIKKESCNLWASEGDHLLASSSIVS